MDIARSEQIEGELDAMIRRRDTHRRQTEGERLEEELYEPSVRAYNALREAEKRADWYAFEMHMGDLHLRLSSEHYAKAEKYLEATEHKESA